MQDGGDEGEEEAGEEELVEVEGEKGEEARERGWEEEEEGEEEEEEEQCEEGGEKVGTDARVGWEGHGRNRSRRQGGEGEEQNRCSLCEKSESCAADRLLICARCELGVHQRCASPPVETAPAGDWLCATCVQAPRQRRATKPRPRLDSE